MGEEEGESRKSPRVNVLRSVKDLIPDVERLLKNKRKECDLVERILWDLYQIEGALEKEPGKGAGTGTGVKCGPAPVAHDMRVVKDAGGRAVLRIDHDKQVPLPRTLAELAAILVCDAGESPDGLVAWKSFDEVGALMQQRLGRKFEHHTLSQLLWRLRKLLGPVCPNGQMLAESRPEKGMRLRVKRGVEGEARRLA
jgi:hypothetical protein